MNKLNEEQRNAYSELENQIEIILQDESLFSVEDGSYFVRYLEDSKIEEQGFKLRFNLTDSISTLKSKLVEILGDEEYTLL